MKEGSKTGLRSRQLLDSVGLTGHERTSIITEYDRKDGF
jgi:hypothetical protein